MKKGTLKLQEITEHSQDNCYSTLDKKRETMSSFANYLASLNIHVRGEPDLKNDAEKSEINSIWCKGRGMELQDSLTGFMNYKKSKIE